MAASTKHTIRALQMGDPYPGRQHTLLAQIPTWADMVSFGQGKPEALAAATHGYPRAILHPDVCRLSSKIKAKLFKGGEDHLVLLLFSSASLAHSCREYMIHLLRREEKSPDYGDSIQLHSIHFLHPCIHHHGDYLQPSLHAVVYPREVSHLARAFWGRAGPGISSRLARQCLRNLDGAKFGPFDPVRKEMLAPNPVVYEAIRSRIAALVDRAAKPPLRNVQTASSDVFLYQSGMAAVYQVHRLLLDWQGGESAHVGLLYEPTLRVLETQGPGLWSYNLGTEADLDRLAAQQELLAQEGRRPLQAVWCECPSNPLLQTVDFHRLRRLADQYGMVLIVDDSIGSFANVDMLDVADIVITSLSKLFSGKADVMAGSVILNPNSPHWGTLHELMASSYDNDLFVADAIKLEYNSRDFLDRVARVNQTTQYLMDKIAPLASDPSSPVTRVFYPSLCQSRQFYERQMRCATKEFRPGYGGLFTIEFATIATAASFFDNLHVYKGFSFGADVSIATPYVQMTMQGGKEHAAKCGVKETIIRFSTGLEEPGEIFGRIETALRAANAVWMRKHDLAS